LLYILRFDESKLTDEICNMSDYKAGQRWITEMEPEMGVGVVKNAGNRTVEIYFPASDTSRTYSTAAAPLKRVAFKSGDTVKTREGASFTITSVSVRDDLITYHGENVDLPEQELSDTISFTTPRERLLNGFVDRNRDFKLRMRALQFQHEMLKSGVRGFSGARIDLIPHQLYVAHQVASRQIPRVLLSDETGLGKTIEACLIIHRLLINERLGRVLILVPDPLVHQWFVELLRRFNLMFRIFDREYCESVVATDSEANPFRETQTGICSIEFLASEAKWKELAILAGWDMVVIDEAHHLTEGSAGYELAERLGSATTGLLLLTATPEQLGHKSHFLRLRLLDPARYHDFELFEKEESQYQKISGIVNKLLENRDLNKSDVRLIRDILPPEPFGGDVAEIAKIDEETRNRLISDLLDRHGTGRAVFRNTRASIAGFPERIAHLVPLDGTEKDIENQSVEFAADNGLTMEKVVFDYRKDARISWLAQFLKKHKDEKVLVISRSVGKAQAIEEALRNTVAVDTALFHEKMTLLQRDRMAGWFAREDGAQLLICSEIGSEGRNFQFAHHLVLFDLPLNPELLEQRIGRLDRIGQTHTIHIHVPYFRSGEYEILARWYHEGLNAFRENVPGVYQVFQELGDELMSLTIGRRFSELNEFIGNTHEMQAAISQRMKMGRDRLLELNSFRPAAAEGLVGDIKLLDKERDMEKFMLDVFRLYGIREDEITERTYRLNLSLLSSPVFPLPPLKQDLPTVTFERKTALSHEDIEFLSWDHPMVIGGMDLVLGSEKGNCASAIWPGSATNEIMLEAVFILECIAPKRLNASRFLPPTPVRVLVNHSLQDFTEKFPEKLLNKALRNADGTAILDHPLIRNELLPSMLKKCEELAEERIEAIKNDGLQSMESGLSGEIRRLLELRKINKNIRDDEILLFRQERDSLREAILAARLRLDALRLITGEQT